MFKRDADGIHYLAHYGAILQVTVAIPTYKTRNTIFKLLDSTAAQCLFY